MNNKISSWNIGDIKITRIIEGERELTGNICADNYAYIGGGYCQCIS